MILRGADTMVVIGVARTTISAHCQDSSVDETAVAISVIAQLDQMIRSAQEQGTAEVAAMDPLRVTSCATRQCIAAADL